MSIDTSTEIHRKLVERLISMTFTDRAVLTEALCADTTTLALAGIRRENPNLSHDEQLYELAVRRYGKAFADETLKSQRRQ